MLYFICGWLIRSLLVILAGTLLLWLLRVKSPSLRLAACSAMLAGSLLLPLFSSALPALPLRLPARQKIIPAAMFPASPVTHSIIATNLSTPQLNATPTQPQPRRSPISFDWTQLAALAYALVSAILLVRIASGVFRARRILRDSRPTGISSTELDVRQSDRIASPVAVSLLRTAVLLPRDWREWEPAKLMAVLAHERSHIRRRDPAIQFISLLHRALLWANPLSWSLHRNIVRTAEQISDDAAIEATGDRAQYAGILLEFIERGIGQGRLITVPIARYDRPERRIRRILDGKVLPPPLTRWSVAAILSLAAPLAYLAAATRPVNRPALNLIAQSVASETPAQPAPPPESAPQPVVEARPAFETASVRPCSPKPMFAFGFGRVGHLEIAPGSLSVTCLSVADMVRSAYIGYANGQYDRASFQAPIVGEPEWAEYDRYDIEAKAVGSPNPGTINGPMLQALLEDRFKVKLHRETREVPVFDLVVAQGGSKLQPFDRSCTPRDFTEPGDPGQPVNPEQCADASYANGIHTWQDLRGISIDDFIFAVLREQTTGRPVINKTGITGLFDIHLDYANDPNLNSPYYGLSVFDALQQQLGLQLVPEEGPVEYLVIDHVERPSEDGATPAPPTVSALQSPAPAFDVVSVKVDNTALMNQPRPRAAAFTSPDTWEVTKIDTTRLVAMALQVHPDQLIGLPAWTDKTLLDITAKLPPNGRQDQLPQMLQSMLAARFQLAAHPDTRELSVRWVAVAKGGPKLAAANSGDCTNDPGVPLDEYCCRMPKTEFCRLGFKNGSAQDLCLKQTLPRCGEVVRYADYPNYQYGVDYSGFSASMAGLVANLNDSGAGQIWVDHTGLTGRYDFLVKIDNSPTQILDGTTVSSDLEARTKEAWRSQTGLDIDYRALHKEMAPVFIIDHLTLPSPN